MRRSPPTGWRDLFRRSQVQQLETRAMLTTVQEAVECVGLATQIAIGLGEFDGLTVGEAIEKGQAINENCGLDRIEAISNKINPLKEKVKQKWDHFTDVNTWLKRFDENGLNLNDHNTALAKKSWEQYNCGADEPGICRDVSNEAFDTAIEAFKSGRTDLNTIDAKRNFLLALTTDKFREAGTQQALVLADTLEAFTTGSNLADSAGHAGSSVFLGGSIDFTQLAMPNPVQVQPASPPASSQQIVGPTGQTTFLDSLDWFGNFGPGDVHGAGDGFSFSSTSGSFRVDWDSATGVSDVQFNVNGSGSYSEPDVSCSGSGGYGSTGDGVFTIDNGTMRVSGSLAGSATGTCLIDTPFGQITEPGDIDFNGTYSGTVSSDFEIAGGIFDVDWTSDLASGSISGVWAADVDPATFDNSVTLTNTPESYATTLAQARALAVGDRAAVYRNGALLIDYVNLGENSRNVTTFQHTGVPITGDWLGQGMTQLGAYDAGLWQFDLDSNGRAAEATVNFGSASAMPVVGDWDGDGRDDLGLFENGTWTLRAADGNTTEILFGSAGDLPLAGDWDGDGDDELGLFNNGSWQLRDDAGVVTNRFFGGGGSLPITGDWDGDGSDGIGVFNAGVWEFDLDDQGGAAERSLTFGQPGDTPLAGAWANFAFDSSTLVSGDVPKEIPDLGTVESELIVTERFVIDDVNVTLTIEHGWDEDLDVFLIGPDGTRVQLFTDVGGDGEDFINLTLDDSAAAPITGGSAPFTGTFRPEGSLAAYNGKVATGTWRLEISDDEELLSGDLLDWSLSFDHRNTPPEINSTSDAALSVGDPLTKSFSATDNAPTNQLRYSLDAAPPGAQINPTTGAFSWATTVADVGSHEVIVRVVDQGTPPLTDTVFFTVDVFPLASDFGDAPTAAQSGFANSYPTLEADGGAAHQIKPGFFLGSSIDDENDGQPDAFAEGDDLDSQGNDDDGVIAFSDFPRGASLAVVDIEITNDAGVANPYLDAWIDFNQDGIWETPAERVASLPVTAGVIQLGFPIPGDALLGDTFARIRLHEATGPGILPTGLASSGEVEDYELTIVELDFHWQNEANPLDVDTANGVTLADALAVVSVLRDAGRSVVPLPVVFAPGEGPPPYVDVDRNNLVSLNDALLIVAFLRDQLAGGEGEFLTDYSSTNSVKSPLPVEQDLFDDLLIHDLALASLLAEMG